MTDEYGDAKAARKFEEQAAEVTRETFGAAAMGVPEEVLILDVAAQTLEVLRAIQEDVKEIKDRLSDRPGASETAPGS
jgi:hypothetical protein